MLMIITWLGISSLVVKQLENAMYAYISVYLKNLPNGKQR